MIFNCWGMSYRYLVRGRTKYIASPPHLFIGFLWEIVLAQAYSAKRQ